MQLPSLPQPGRPIESAWAKQVINYLKALTWQSTPSLKVDIGPGGTTGWVVPQTRSPAPLFTPPFECTLVPQTNPDGTPAGNKVGVEYNSTLFKSLIPLEEFSGITGLNDPDATPTLLDLDGPDVTTGYVSPDGPDDYVILEVSFNTSDGSVSSVSVETNGSGSTVDPTYDAWDDSGDALVAHTATEPFKQTKARIVLATYQDGQLQQNVIGNLVLIDMAINGRAALYPVRY